MYLSSEVCSNIKNLLLIYYYLFIIYLASLSINIIKFIKYFCFCLFHLELKSCEPSCANELSAAKMTNAGSTRMSIEDMIGHYQRSIEKSENDPKRVSAIATSAKVADSLFISRNWPNKQAITFRNWQSVAFTNILKSILFIRRLRCGFYISRLRNMKL